MLSAAESGGEPPSRQAPALSSQAGNGAVPLDQLLLEVKALAVRLRQFAGTETNGDGVPATRGQILRLLKQHGTQTVPELARHRQTSRQNIQVLVNRLVQEGCVKLTENPAHKRSALIHLTERGQTLMAATNLQEEARTTDLATQFSHTDLLSATQLLRQLREKLEQDLTAAKSPRRNQAHKLSPQTPVQEPPPTVHPALPQESSDELPVSLL